MSNSMSEKDLRLAAEKNIKVDSATQNKIMEEQTARVKARVAELRAAEEAEALAKKEAERIANLPPMSKRQKLEAERRAEQEAQLAAVGIDPSTLQDEYVEPLWQHKPQQFASNDVTAPSIKETKIREDIETMAPIKPVNNGATFKPFAVAQQKVRVSEVPSYGLSYPEGWEIYVTPYSGDDLDDLNNSKLSLKYILTKCLEGVYTNFDKNQITFYDALYLSYYRRILSIDDNKIQVLSQCPHCGSWASRIVDVNKEIEFEESIIPSLPINVEFSFGKLSFTYLTYKNFMDLQTELRSEELAMQCVTPCEVNKEQGETQVGELQKLFGSLVGRDAQLLSKVRQYTYHGIKPLQTLCQNKECGQAFETIIDEMSSLITPFRGSQEDLGSQISFG